VETAYFTSGSNGIRKVLLDQKATVANNTSLQIKEREPIVLIKPDAKSRYKNVVDILDEMKICDIKIYAIVDISVPEKEMIKNIVVTE
jgi:biopolymer transport protein ExbD